jgi:hypothetical protein
MAHRLDLTAFRWGIQLGLGVCSFVVTPGLYALLAVAVGEREAVFAWTICLVYGVTRGGTIAGFSFLNARRDRTGGGPQPGTGLERVLRIPLVVSIAVAAYLLIT